MSVLYQWQCKHIATEVFKSVKNLGTPGCSSMLIFRHEIHELHTRSAGQQLLNIPKTKLRMTERDFAVIGPIVWNQIPWHIRGIDSLPEFKTAICNFIFNWNLWHCEKSEWPQHFKSTSSTFETASFLSYSIHFYLPHVTMHLEYIEKIINM